MKSTYASSLGYAAAKDGRPQDANPYRSDGNLACYGPRRAAEFADQWDEGWRTYQEERE